MANETTTQTQRTTRLNSPLGPDVLLLTGFTIREGMSQLFHMQIDCLARSDQAVAFDRLLGQKASIEMQLPAQKKRFFHGIVCRVGQGGQSQGFTGYQLEIVPQFWLLTRRWQSRIFQHLSVPDILKKVLAGLDVAFEIQGTFYPRDFCVQYRESDYNFASRLMEEEGIFYFFKHTADGHKMVVANMPTSHPDVPEQSRVVFGGELGGPQAELRIFTWGKLQELRSGKYTLFDHCFELPHKHLEAEKTIVDSVQVGQASHKLKVGGNDRLEIYDWPGEYAQRFDGVDKGGGDRPADVQRIFEDNRRTAAIRMEQETLPGLVIRGSGNCRQFTSGHKFTLERHFSGNGEYLLTAVTHVGRQNVYRTAGATFEYSNNFTCIPAAQPFRPQRQALKPIIHGTQTAVVVGPSGEEIFTDKYGRVKVQFHWDREGQSNADSSCWVRVGQLWAGKRWGASFWPRIGQEVIVAFQEGDPDQPIIIGSVYNAEQMPPYLGDGPDAKHKKDNKVSGIKTNTTPGGRGFNELRFDDAKDKEQVFIHAERNMDMRIKNESRETVVGNRHLIVGSGDAGDQRELVHNDKHLQVKGNQIELIETDARLTVGGNQDIVVKMDKKELVEQNSHVHVKLARNEKVDMDQSLTVGMNQHEKVGMNHALDAGMAIHLKAGMNVVIEAGIQLTLKAGASFIDISPAGIAISGSPMVMLNSGGAAGVGAGSNPTAPEDAHEAEPTRPDAADNAVTGQKSAP
jgi:type VI secretion system secreted protein VgrG